MQTWKTGIKLYMMMMMMMMMMRKKHSEGILKLDITKILERKIISSSKGNASPVASILIYHFKHYFSVIFILFLLMLENQL